MCMLPAVTFSVRSSLMRFDWLSCIQHTCEAESNEPGGN